MLGAALPALDLSAVLQFAFALLLTLSGALLVVKRAASRYFVVDASFEAGSSGYEPRRSMSIGNGDAGGEGAAPAGGACATCGKPGSKKCSGCKRVRYCSQACQSKHWRADHKFECKQLKSSEPDKVDIVSPDNSSCRRRKSSGFGSISLVPARGTCNILQEPKKILFPYDEFVKLFNWDNPGFPPCGLVNCGNSCFANVVLQCLACTRPLVAYLLERGHIRECVRKQNDWCFLCELQLHIKRASESRHPFSPINILSRLPNIGGNLGYGRQEDAHEFMRFAIDTMQSVCLDEFGGEKALDPSTQDTTLIQHIFGGHLQSQVTCTQCNTISNRYENMMDLTVEILGDAESLEECLDQFTMKEWLDGDNKYKCDGCNDYVKACKRLTVHQAPNILTIALKRFQSGRFGKLNKRVTFPENLNLTPYMSGSSDGTDLYTLYAVVVHVDMLNASFFGHYICYTKDYQGRWYKIDDCKVTNVEVEDVLSEGAYMLLYSRTSARKEPFVKHVQSQNTKQLVESAPKLSSPIGVSCLGSDIDNQSSPPELSMFRDTRNKRKLTDDVDPAKVTEVDVMVLNTPLVEKPASVHKSLGDLDFCNSSSSSATAKSLEKESIGLFSSMPDYSSGESMQLDNHPENSENKVDVEKCQKPCASYDASHIVEDGEPTREPSTMQINDDMIIEPCSTTPITTESVVSEPSDYSFAESDCPVETYSQFDSSLEVTRLDGASVDSEGSMGLLSSQENRSSRKSKALFSRGFLDKPARKKTLDSTEEKQNHKHPIVDVNKQNGHSNGHWNIGLAESTENGENIISGDMPFVTRGFLQKSYAKSSDMKMREPKKSEHQCRVNCNGSAEYACSSADESIEFRSAAPCCNGASFMQIDNDKFPDSASVKRERERERDPSTIPSYDPRSRELGIELESFMDESHAKQILEQQVLTVARAVEDKIDDEIAALDRLDLDDFEDLRERRLQQLKKMAEKRSRWLSLGHGEYTEIPEKEFFAAVKASDRVVCHFYRENWPCKVMDKHLSILAKQHIETRFLKIHAEKSPFLTEKLRIIVLPTLALVKNAKVEDYVVGFEELGGTDDFSTEELEERLAKSQVISFEGEASSYPTKSNKTKRSVHQSETADSSDSD
ncbi:unnamed protein product [Musa hybrid cultivar]